MKGQITYSQLKQDLDVLEFFKDPGYFLDVGAHDGVTYSNTLLLEKHGWDGILFEPQPKMCKKIKRNRKVRLIESAVYSKSNLILEFAVSDTLLGGIARHRTVYTADLEKSKRYNVKTTTLAQELERASSPKIIQYMSLDVEGAELEVLKGMDWSYTIQLIDLEHNDIPVVETDREKASQLRKEMREYLIARGYHYVGENKWDDQYVHSSVIPYEWGDTITIDGEIYNRNGFILTSGDKKLRLVCGGVKPI